MPAPAIDLAVSDRRSLASWLPAAAVWATVLILVLLLAHALLRVPVTYGDQFREIVIVLTQPFGEAMSRYFQEDYHLFRPLEQVIRYLIFWVFGDHLISYARFQILVVALSAILALRLMPIRSLADAGAAVAALMCLFGHHAFTAVLEANITLSNGVVMLLMFLVLNVLRSEGGLPWQIVAVAATACALATKEVGITIPVVLIAARLLGFRAVRNWTALVALGLLLAYLAFRVATQTAGEPAPGKADTLFEFLKNVLTTPVMFVLGDPYDADWRNFLGRDLPPWRLLRWAVGGLTVAVILLGFLVRRSSPERYRRGETVDWPWLLLLLVVLGASSALAFYYSRHRFGAMALPIVVLLLFYASRSLIGTLGAAAAGPGLRIAGAGLLALVSLLWSERALNTVYAMREVGGRHKVSWVEHFHRYRGYEAKDPDRHVYLDAFFWAAQDLPWPSLQRDPREARAWLGGVEAMNR